MPERKSKSGMGVGSGGSGWVADERYQRMSAAVRGRLWF